MPTVINGHPRVADLSVWHGAAPARHQHHHHHAVGETTIQQWGGFTSSSLTPPGFTGQFWHQPVNGQPFWEQDQNVIIIIDAPDQTLDDILPYFARLRDLVNGVYLQVGQPQAALWITAQPLSILWD